MGKTNEAQTKLLEVLGKAPNSKKALKKIVKASRPQIAKHVKKALRKLEARGEIERNGDLYQIASVMRETERSQNKNVLPIGMQMRKAQTQKKSVAFSEPEVDLDDEIRRLEQELQNSESSDSDDDEGGDEDSTAGIVCLSAFADDRSEHLPESCLPEPGKYSSRAGKSPNEVGTNKRHEIEKRRAEERKNSGLEQAVKEVLNGYKPRSSERLPFYCRYCAKQYNNETEFFEHKQTEFHKTAVDMERRATYCRLCNKQLTSPAQMKEHLKSRPHKERLQNVRERQRGQGNRRSDPKRRQWC